MKLSILALAGAALTLSACGTVVEKTPWAGFSSVPMAQNVIYANEDCDGSSCRAGSNVNPNRLVSQRALEVVANYSRTCQEDVGRQVAGPMQGAASGAVTFGLAGGAGTATGAGWAFGKSIDAWEYARYGGAAGALSGAVTGSLLTAQGAASAKGNCVKDKFDDVRAEFPGVHVGVALAGKSVGGKKVTTTEPPPPPPRR